MSIARLIAASFIASAMCCAAARADFVNITIENENAFFSNHPNMTVRNAWNALGGTLDVYRVYANFDGSEPSDHLHRVLGAPQTPSFLISSDGFFFNVVVPDGKGGVIHFDSPVRPTLYNSQPALAWDTFATVGFGPNAAQGGFFTPPGGAALDHLQTNWVNTSEEWLHGPSFPAEGDAVPGGPSGYRVGLFQATVAAGVQIEGQFAIDTGYGIFWGDNTSFTTIPAPASAILFIFACGMRRRRRVD